MTIQNLTTKLKKRAWIVILGTIVIGGLGFFQSSKNVSYITSDNLAITLKNYQSVYTDSQIKQEGSDQAYVGAVNFGGLFLTNQLKSMPIQVKIAEEAKIKITSAIEKKPIYSVEDITGGYVMVINKFDAKEKALDFQRGLKLVAQKEIESNYNLNRNVKFIGEVKVLDSSISEIKAPLETQVLPSIAGFILLVAICSFAPSKKV